MADDQPRLELSARQRRYLRRHGRRPDVDPSELDEELNIIPYLDVVVNLIMFLLMVISSAAFFTQVNVSLAGTEPTHVGPRTHELGLSVTVADGGIIVADADGMLAPGCEHPRPGASVITVPKRGDAFDFASLTSCASALKRRHPGESRVTMSADPRVSYQDLLAAIDAVRADGTDPLFDEVTLSAGVR